MTRAQFADLNLVNDPYGIKRYEEYGPALYMPHAYRPDVHYPRRGPVNPELAADLTFIGTAFQSRIGFFETMAKTGHLRGLDVLLGGSDWDANLAEDSPLRAYLSQDNPADCVDNAETAELYRHAKCGINVYRRESEEAHAGEGWAMGPREVEMAACALPFLRDPRPESDEVFRDILPSFATPEDAAEQLLFYLDRPDWLARTGQQAREAVADRTFVTNAKRLLRALDAL